MQPACHICGTPSSFLMKKDGFDLYRCPTCALVFVFPVVPIETLRTDVYSKKSGFQANRAVALDSVEINRRPREVLDYLRRTAPGATLLDVGTGNGFFIHWAKQHGFDAHGVELNDRLAESAKAQGLDVFNGTLQEAPDTMCDYDVIFMGEVIEHVPDPRALVTDAKKRLKPGGRLVITTPNLDCLWSTSTFKLFQWFGIPWSSCTPPWHLYQFSSANLDRLLAEQGFKVEKEWYLPQPPLKYELGSLHLLKRYKQSRSIKDLAYLVFAFGLYIPWWAIVRACEPFLRKNFQMVKVYV
ncbi:MAG TPA: class I SAM-dependent methyltransferase [Verrucomicrobiae bacterium]|nr:class I SAM-dependent methyltransferase [Verrucomicrobiae bacterium]